MVLFAACKEEEPVLPQNPEPDQETPENSEPDQETPEVITLKLTESEVTIVAGETHQLALEAALPEGVAVIWKSENTDIATVDNNGLVTAVAEGTTNVSVELSDGSSKAVCAVTVELAVLNNQYALNNDVHSIGSVIELKSLEAGYRLALYEQEGVTDKNTIPTIELYVDVDTEPNGEILNLADGIVTVSFKGEECTLTSGSLKISKRKTMAGGETVTVALDAVCDLGRLRANYTGLFAVVERYEGTNTLVVATNDSRSELPIPSMLRKPAVTGEHIGFAFGNIEATLAEDYLEAKYAVWVDISQSAFGERTIDMTAEKDYYTFTFIDYDNTNVYDATNAIVREGTIRTHKTTDGRVYLALNVTLDKGFTITAEYFGEVTDVDDLTPMIPSKKESWFYFYGKDGTLGMNAPINTATRKTNTKGLYVFDFGNNDPSVFNYNWPRLTVSPDFVNGGVIDLSTLEPNTFEIRLDNGFTLYSPDNAYKATPNNGTLEIKSDDKGNYTINLDVQNYYTKGDSDEQQGDPSRIVIEFDGPVTEK